MSHPFVIWTMQRTGGSALAEILMDMSEHPKTEHEPFNWSRDQPRQFWPIVETWTASRDGAALATDLAGLASRGFLIKHCYELFNMTFNVALLEATAKAGYRHILLLRRDEGARLVSKFIADAQGTWFAEYGREVYAEVGEGRRQLSPIPVDQVVAQYHHSQNCTAALGRAFGEHRISVMELTYEELYLAERASRSQRFGAVLETLAFPLEDRPSKIEAFLDRTKLGGQRTSGVLSRVPNIEEVVEGLAAAGCAAPGDFVRRRQLEQLKAQLSRHASARGWMLLENLDHDWPGFSFKFDQASSLEFRIESADMSFNNVYFGLKNATPLHNKSLDEALTVALGKADYSEAWPWCRHPNPDDDILPIEPNWAFGSVLARGIADGSLASCLVSAAEIFLAALGAAGYVAIGEAEWAQLHGQISAAAERPLPISARIGAVPGLRPTSLLNAHYLASLNLAAGVIIDVGVWAGTSQLYEAFPDRPFVLVDPQRGAEDLLKSRPNHYRFVNKALGRHTGHALLTDSGAKSSLLERTALTSEGHTVAYEVEVTTLDELIDDLCLTGPIGLKLDTEGYEIEIMSGLDRHAGKVEFAICEASVRKRFVDSYQFSDLVAFMRDKGLLFYNVLNGQQRHPLFYDVLFLKMGHQLFG